MNERRASISRNILALGAMFGGMPLYAGVPRRQPEPPPRFPEAKVLAVELGVTYGDAELAFLRLGPARAREVLTLCQSRNLAVSHELLDLLENPPPAAMADLSEAFKKAKADPQSLLRPAVPEVRQQRRSLVERKARRAKRKQRGKR